MANNTTWRPERRNRKIGTAAAGYSQNNDMRVPEHWQDRHGIFTRFYERLNTVTTQHVTIGEHVLTVLHEPARDGFTHGCKPSDVIHLLRAVAQHVSILPELLVFRQPTRKQAQQNPVWGRFVYYADVEKHSGSAIIIEAVEIGMPLIWPRNMSIEARAEFERLTADGHEFHEGKRDFKAQVNEETTRNTILYRTVLHELGHLIHYHQDVDDQATALDDDCDVARELHFSKPSAEREVFAHRFADELGGKLREIGVIPFDPMSDQTP
jgi:hypothetical protein